nr:hypothetical protein [Tanacetum cinerariifolium]
NATGAQVWEVTNPRRPRAQTLANGSFAAYTDSVREYVAFQPNGTFDTPRLFGKVTNQNLHALNANGTLDLVIVTYPPFRAQAERLAQHRRTYDGLNVAVVTTKEVFNDDTNLDPDLYNQNLVPTYESRESFLPVAGNRPYAEGVSSYSSEDYFGLLDDNEGTWTEFDGARYEACDIGVGRIPVRPPRA